MTNSQEQVNAIRREIDLMTQEMQNKIHQSQYGELGKMLDLRFNLIKKLTAFFEQDIDKEALKNYIFELHQRDQVIIEYIRKARNEVETSLLNVNKLIHYTNPATRIGAE